MVCLAGYGPARLRVLVAESDAMAARRLAASLAAGLLNTEVEIASQLEEAECRLRGARFSALVASHSLGEDALPRLRPLMQGALVMLGDARSGDSFLSLGADDYLPAFAAPALLAERLREAIRKKPVDMEQTARGPARFEGFIGASAPMREVYARIERVAASRAPVFISGESGTGKELAAHAVHTRSGRSGAFIVLNCGAIPAELIESELFGHMRGAFTGAVEDHAGAAEAADGGTLFLDELCEMPVALQTRLLRFVQTGEIRRIGSTKLRKTDVRIVCATNRDPKTEIAAGRFREDLFYRLHVLPVSLPPLRTRGQDSLLLARTFLASLAREEDRSFTGFDPLAERLLASYAWPGNVRELESAIRRAVVLNDGVMVTADMLPPEIAAAVLGAAAANAASGPRGPTSILPMRVQEERIIEEALAFFGGNIAKAAAALEINPSTIYRRRQVAVRTAAE